MYVEEDNYDKFKEDSVNILSTLNYRFVLNQRFVEVKDNQGNYFKCQTPFLKVLKPMHITLNKKKTVAKKYLILETSDDLDFNNQIGDFLYVINKVHELSQEKIKENSMEWFNTEFDEIGLDIKVRRPVDEQRNSQFIKLSIPKNKEIEEEICNLSKDMYVLCDIVFKGLKVSNDYIMEEWELENLITQEKFDEMQNMELLGESIKEDRLTTMLDEIEEVHVNVENNNIETEVINQVYSNMENNMESNTENHEVQNNNLEEILEENLNLATEQENTEITNMDNKMEKDNVVLTQTDVSVSSKKIMKKKKSQEKSVNEMILENKLKKYHTTDRLIKKSSKKLIFT